MVLQTGKRKCSKKEGSHIILARSLSLVRNLQTWLLSKRKLALKNGVNNCMFKQIFPK